jgi:hypothetical protein
VEDTLDWGQSVGKEVVEVAYESQVIAVEILGWYSSWLRGWQNRRMCSRNVRPLAMA